jgi:signal transduction histidine kinase
MGRSENMVDDFREGWAAAEGVSPSKVASVGGVGFELVLAYVLGWLIVPRGALIPHGGEQALVFAGLLIPGMVQRWLVASDADGRSTRKYAIKLTALVITLGVALLATAAGVPPTVAAGSLVLRLAVISAYISQGSLAVWLAVAGLIGAVPILGHADVTVFSPSPATAHQGVEDAIRLLVVAALFAGLTALGRREVESEQRVAGALAAERTRIARELHDVVAHQMTGVTLLAQGAGAVADTDPAATRAALVTIEQTSRAALVELRRLLGVLREDGPGQPSATGEPVERGGPQPTLDDIDTLLHNSVFESSEVHIALERPVPAGVQLSAYRIVQEALTNAARYACGSPVRIEVRTAGDHLEVAVSDEGPATRAARAVVPGSGLGLTGMRERAELLGGHLTAGKRAGGGWTVEATLPLDNVAAP